MSIDEYMNCKTQLYGEKNDIQSSARVRAFRLEEIERHKRNLTWLNEQANREIGDVYLHSTMLSLVVPGRSSSGACRRPAAAARPHSAQHMQYGDTKECRSATRIHGRRTQRDGWIGTEQTSISLCVLVSRQPGPSSGAHQAAPAVLPYQCVYFINI